MSFLVKGAVDFFKDGMRQSFRARVKPLGLYYDDLLVITPDVEKAISRLPHDVAVERTRRIKRAFDLSAKKKELPIEMQNYDPLQHYLSPLVKQVEMERLEREKINWY